MEMNEKRTKGNVNDLGPRISRPPTLFFSQLPSSLGPLYRPTAINDRQRAILLSEAEALGYNVSEKKVTVFGFLPAIDHVLEAVVELELITKSTFKTSISLDIF